MCTSLHKFCAHMLWQVKGKPRFGSPLKWITLIGIKDCSWKEHSWHMYTRYDAIYIFFIHLYPKIDLTERSAISINHKKLIWIRKTLLFTHVINVIMFLEHSLMSIRFWKLILWITNFLITNITMHLLQN